jgi:hypothetical protein
MPDGMSAVATVANMAKNEAKDPIFEERLRAHVRARLERLGWGSSRLATEIGFSQGYVSHWLLKDRGDRGVSALFLFRSCRALELDPLDVFNNDPDPKYFRTYVPRQRAEPVARRHQVEVELPPAGITAPRALRVRPGQVPVAAEGQAHSPPGASRPRRSGRVHHDA